VRQARNLHEANYTGLPQSITGTASLKAELFTGPERTVFLQHSVVWLTYAALSTIQLTYAALYSSADICRTLQFS
jgi:hypothetical protein